ncbi:uncharacterized protein LOC119110273 [Pollicipes pollicipes]|uniref:uncharacterized protein LOC119110273 n=1 Tax=Pollicipes pollicipes TaxID=41117 RepID=UPI001884F45D|nr:uncharacterized protein LOC119110273 [Pollicipes pollicipes]
MESGALASPNDSRSVRGIKRPKRFDDFQCPDGTPVRAGVLESAANPLAGCDAQTGVTTPGPPVVAAGDMTELANKQPAALKAIIRILREENQHLRGMLETERGRAQQLAAGVERLVRGYRDGTSP